MSPGENKIKRSELKDFKLVLKPGESFRVRIIRDPGVEVFFIEIGDTLLRFNSGVLLPVESAASADGVSRPGLSVIAACIEFAANHKDKKMLIAGHTDTVGSDEANVALSRIRAEAVHGMITGDRRQFATACRGPHLTDEQRYPDGGSGKKKGVLWDDYIDVLNWAAKEFGWPCGYPAGNSTLWAATVAFQKSYNKSDIGDTSNKPIPEYGSFDLPTWGAVYDCYEVKLAELLRTDNNGLTALRGDLRFVNDDPEKHFVGCGEFKPIAEKDKDNYNSQTNRRVEVLFFDKLEVPCIAGECSPDFCQPGPTNFIPIPITPDPDVPVAAVELLRVDGSRFPPDFPGELVIANIDVHDRPLPALVTAGTAPVKDFHRPVANDADNSLVHFFVHINDPAAIQGQKLFLRFVGFPTPAPGNTQPTIMHTRIGCNDANGIVLPNPPGSPHERVVPPPSGTGDIALSLEARTIPGSPFGHSSTTIGIFQPDDFEESHFEIEVLSRSATAIETVHDRAKFSVAPVILADRIAPVIRLYICDFPGNRPSLVEITQAVAAIGGVQLVTVPLAVANGDAWLQDQYQHSIVRGRDGVWTQMILHLPRMRQNTTNATGLGNLADFIESHFPSNGIGVFSDLWDRELLTVEASGNPRRIPFRDTFGVFAAMNSVLTTDLHIDDYGRYASGIAGLDWPESAMSTWSQVRRNMTVRLALLIARVNAARLVASADQNAHLRRIEVDATREVAQIELRYPLSPASIGIPVAGDTVNYGDATADRVFSRCGQMHSGGNYGGNIESVPPTATAPLGVILLGNHPHAVFGEFVDPDLKRVLVKQSKQPIVELDTTWLAVGHVDEIMAVVPSSNGSSTSFAILNADPQIGMRLVRAAEGRYRNGLPPGDPHGNDDAAVILPSRISRRRTDAGTSPVTRLFRGKTWIHRHTVTDDPAQAVKALPPVIYRRIARAYERGPGGSVGTDHGIGFVPGGGADRFYFADITVRELIFAEEDRNDVSSNIFIDEQFIRPAIGQLQSAFPGVRILPLPVVFDGAQDTDAWSTNTLLESTIAFSPDLVNLQVLGRHVLLPRPYGPRMRPPDAIAIVRQVMTEFGLDATIIARVDNGLISRHTMQTGIYWLERSERIFVTQSSGGVITSYGGILNQDDVIDLFRDSFPGASDAVLRQRIIAPNAANFDGNELRDGFQRFVIQENMVDLFELFSLAVLEELDLVPHIVDSWFYHSHDGGIHCGTNVLQLPPNDDSLPNPVDAPDVS